MPFSEAPASRRTGPPQRRRIRTQTSPETPISILREAAKLAQKETKEG
jgi:hypothetical protein